MLAASVNPADLNMIEGTYGIKPKKFPSVPGIEGVGEVLYADPASGLKPGDWVVPKIANGFLGTWQPYIVANNGDMIKLQSKLPLVSAATILGNPITAYRMLKEFETLKPGDCVLQNGGNSAVGEAVIQLCREFQLQCISLIRPRPKFELKPLKARLLSLGNRDTKIITEDELKSTMKGKRAQLGLDCIGGKSAMDVIRFLESSRTMVTYGGMSRDPVIIRASQLIFNDIRIKGFWLSRDAEMNSWDNQTKVINEFTSLMASGKFVPPVHKLLPLAKYRVAFKDKGQKGVKYIFTFDNKKAKE
ncbi:unnamed protein product [Orchesella dallaii]|uniref:Enoyl-[acyl-carrier-protein] reductase, mitochondrial n=1 Tax=Orchesella dallaii TaxID=48710 RepID=A0ABP1QTK2_9HEXA